MKRKGKAAEDGADGDGADGGPAASKKRKLKDAGGGKNKRRKLNEPDLGKLQEEMEVLVTKIFKKFPDGLDMIGLWRKITASLSADTDSIKKVLPLALKAVAKKIKSSDGKKHIYTLKDRLKK